jgi:prepilin-type N-terminal cleavage/methylation domain-containing protein
MRTFLRRPRRLGFTLLEVLTVTVIVGILAAIAAPSFNRIRSSAALQSGRAQVTGALGLAQTTGVRWGRTTTVAFDTLLDMITIRVDTGSLMGPTASVVVRQYRLTETGVQLRSNRTAICYRARGVGITSTGCPSTGAQLIVVAGSRLDTVLVNSAGRVYQ